MESKYRGVVQLKHEKNLWREECIGKVDTIFIPWQNNFRFEGTKIYRDGGKWLEHGKPITFVTRLQRIEAILLSTRLKKRVDGTYEFSLRYKITEISNQKPRLPRLWAVDYRVLTALYHNGSGVAHRFSDLVLKRLFKNGLIRNNMHLTDLGVAAVERYKNGLNQNTKEGVK